MTDSLELVREHAANIVKLALLDGGLAIEQPRADVFVVQLPGEHKLTTPCAIAVGPHTVTVNAFVARAPEENREEVYRLLLQRNPRLVGVSFALDRLGDIYLVGRLPSASLTVADVDALLGSLAHAADSMFDHILALGFESSIRHEWRWRRSKGEPADNLEPFRALLDLRDDDVDAEPAPS